MRPRLLAGLVVAATLLVPARAIAAPAIVTSQWLAPVNAFRAQHGLPPVATGNATAESVLLGLAATAPRHEGSWRRDECAGCTEYHGDPALERDRPPEVYASRGGTGAARFAMWRSDWAPERNLTFFVHAQALLLDPRATSFAAATNDSGESVLVAVILDPRRTFSGVKVLQMDGYVPSNTLGGREQLPLAPGVLVGPATPGRPLVVDRRGGRRAVLQRLAPVEPTLDLTRVVGGAEEHEVHFPDLLGARYFVVEHGDNGRATYAPYGLAYDRTYAIELGRHSVPLRTSRPRTLGRGTWRFSRRTPVAQRRRFRRLVAAAPPQLAAMLARLDGRTTIDVSPRPDCMLFAKVFCGHTGVDYGVRAGADGPRFRIVLSPRFLFRPWARFHLYHELGHLVDFGALDDEARVAFGRAWRASGRWRRCFTHGRHCTLIEETFAQQFALWGTGRRAIPSDSVYRTPRLLPNGRFGRMLRDNLSYRYDTSPNAEWYAVRKRVFRCAPRCRF